MNTLENYRQRILKKYELDTKRNYVSVEENDKLKTIYLSPDSSEKENELLKQYQVEELNFDYKFYTTEKISITNEEINQFILMKLLEENKSMNEKQYTIKSILIFWLVLTIISLVASLYVYSKII